MNQTKLTFIGAGNMARSLIGGLVADGWNPAAIRVADPNPEQLQWTQQFSGLQHFAENSIAISGSEVVILAVKPQNMHAVTQDIADIVQQQKPLIVSIAAGIKAVDLYRWLGDKTALVRCMPNTPALVQSGATALYANTYVSEQQHDLAESILRAVGLTLWVDDEAMMDAVTALSGSGPAYIFLVIEALQAAGSELGLPPETARLLALQTAFGAAKMALESQHDASVLRQRVTSPGGTTESALQVLEEGNLRGLFADALKSASNRSKQLAEQFGAE
jgi:pyrroline-5-carboxylate reductase